MENTMSDERINRLLAEGYSIDEIDKMAYQEAENAYWAACGGETEEVKL